MYCTLHCALYLYYDKRRDIRSNISLRLKEKGYIWLHNLSQVLIRTVYQFNHHYANDSLIKPVYSLVRILPRECTVKYTPRLEVILKELYLSIPSFRMIYCTVQCTNYIGSTEGLTITLIGQFCWPVLFVTFILDTLYFFYTMWKLQKRTEPPTGFISSLLSLSDVVIQHTRVPACWWNRRKNLYWQSWDKEGRSIQFHFPLALSAWTRLMLKVN